MTDAAFVFTTPEGRERAQELIDDMELHRKAAVWCNEPYVERLIERDRIICAIATAALRRIDVLEQACAELRRQRADALVRRRGCNWRHWTSRRPPVRSRSAAE